MQGQDSPLPDTKHHPPVSLHLHLGRDQPDIFTINPIKFSIANQLLVFKLTLGVLVDNIYKTGSILGINVGVLLIRS